MLTAEQYTTGYYIPQKAYKRLLLSPQQYKLDCIARYLEPGRNVLDVGCALGHAICAIRTRAEWEHRKRIAHWIGVDCSATAIAECELWKERGYRDSKWEHMPTLYNIGNLPEKFYTNVVCSEVLDHVEDDALLLRLMWERTARRLIVTVPRVRTIEPGTLRVYTREALTKLYDSLPCIRTQIRQEGHFWHCISTRE